MSLIVAQSPTYAFYRNPFEHATFNVDLGRFARLIRGQLEAEPTVNTNPSGRDIYELARQSGVVAVDIETAPQHREKPWTGKDPTRARLRTIGFGTPTHGLSFVWKGDGNEVEQAAKEVLADPSIIKVFHNGFWFDVRVLSRYGAKVADGSMEDTRDLRRALSSTSPLSLAYVGSLYTDFEPWKEDDEEDSKGLVFTDDYEKLKRYNALDTVVTARAWAKMWPEAQSDQRVLSLYKMHKQLSEACAEMHTHGFKLNLDKRAELDVTLLAEYERRKALFLDAVAQPGMRCNPNDMRALLYRRYAKEGIKCYELPEPLDPKCWSPSGNIKVDFKSLLQLYINPGTPPDLKPIIQLYWDAQEVQKARSTFVSSEKISQAIGDDAYIRVGWNSCGTDTGRFSCSEPNLLNIEQKLRHMYTASPGNVLVHLDYSQQELWVNAAISHDEVLEENLKSGDIYTAEAKEWFGLPKHLVKCECQTKTCEHPDKHVKSGARKTSKIVHLASQYGAGTETVYMSALAEDYTIQFKLVEALHKGFKKTYKGTVDYWYREQALVNQTGYSESRIMHRRRVYPAPPTLNDVANYPIQSTASDMTNLAFLRIRERLRDRWPKAHLVCQQYDAVDIDCPAEWTEEVEDMAAEEMTRPVMIEGREWSIPVDAKIAVSWGDV